MPRSSSSPREARSAGVRPGSAGRTTGSASPAEPAASTPLGVQVFASPSDGSLRLSVRFSYTGQLPSLPKRASMARDLLRQALDRLERYEPSEAWTGFREGAHERLRADDFDLQPP